VRRRTEGAPTYEEPARHGARVLLIILGLELLETLRTYFSEHRVRL
jgi:hypothetical protein